MALTTTTRQTSNIFAKFLPFWLFLFLFKFGAGLHYTLMAPLGVRLMPAWEVGLLIGGGSFVLLLLDVPAGHLLDRFGYRRLLKIATFIFLLGAAVLLFKFTLTVFLVTFAVGELGWLFFDPGSSAYVLSQAPRENAGKFISLRDVSGSLGIVLASAILGFTLGLSTQHMAAIILVLLAAALLALWVSPKDQHSVHEEKKLETHHYYVRRKRLLAKLKVIRDLNPASAMLLALSLVSSIFYGIVWFVVPVVIEQQAAAGILGIGLGVFDFAVVVLGFALGGIADRGNKRTLVFFGLLLFSVAAFVLGFTFNWLFLIFGFLATTGDEMASISLWSWLHSLDREHANDGLIAGVITLAQDLGWAIGPAAAGILYTLIGPSWTIASGAILLFVTWILFRILARGAIPVLLQKPPRKPHRLRFRK